MQDGIAQNPSCTYFCNAGRYGHPQIPGVCVRCSELMTNYWSPPPTLPVFSAWVDDAGVCNTSTWSCLAGYARRAYLADILCCPTSTISNSHAAPDGTVFPCGVECDAGFYWNASLAACVGCGAPPANGYWQPRTGQAADLSTCRFGCNLGFQPKGDGSQSCVACPSKPTSASWTPPSSAAYSICAFSCNVGYYGHPQYWGVCVLCSDLLDHYVPSGTLTPKPAVGGIWNNTAGRCDDTVWSCAAGFRRSPLGSRFCCPSFINNSSPLTAGYDQTNPCGISCNTGYTWDVTQAACSPCQGLPGHASWTYMKSGSQVLVCSWTCDLGYTLSADDASCGACPAKPSASYWAVTMQDGIAQNPSCTYFCNAGRYGHPQIPGVCVRCSELMTNYWSPPPTLPVFSAWVDDAGVCNTSTWSCLAGYLRSVYLGAELCCPTSVSNAQLDGTSAPCGWACNAGYYWNAAGLNCSTCPGVPPVGETWGPNCIHVFDCQLYSTAMGIALPTNGVWPLTANGPSDCKLWTCKDGYDRNDEICCSKGVLGFGDAGGSWAIGSCQWKCFSGLYFSLPPASCLQCVEFLASTYNVDFCERCGDNNQCCDGRMETSLQDWLLRNRTCNVSQIISLQATGLTASGLLVGRTYKNLLGSLQTVLKRTVLMRSISLATDSATQIAIVVVVPGLDPNISKAFSDFVRNSTSTIQRSLSNALTPALFNVTGLSLIASTSSVACQSGYVMNEATDSCCSVQYDLPGAGANWSRILWFGRCSWTCDPSFVRVGLACYTCSEKNAMWPPTLVSLPVNAAWNDSDAPSCLSWVCASGYVPRANLSGCVALTDLTKECARSSRCSTCSLNSDCSWCGTKGCVPGTVSKGSGCRFVDSQTKVCDCQLNGCIDDCKGYKTCLGCLGDNNCGWCGTDGICKLDISTVDPRAAVVIGLSTTQNCVRGWLGHNETLGLSIGMAVACPPVGNGWTCSSGFVPSPLGIRYCCPLVIPNSRVSSDSGAYSPCGVVCEDGYRWNGTTAMCDKCTGLPVNASWVSKSQYLQVTILNECSWSCNAGFKLSGLGTASLLACIPCPPKPIGSHWDVVNPADINALQLCSYSCDSGLYGHPIISGLCVNCSSFMVQAASLGLFDPLPLVGAAWSDSVGHCDSSSWTCQNGFQRSPTGTRFCCPLSIANSVSSLGSVPCGVVCTSGYFWSNASAQCLSCPSLPADSSWLQFAVPDPARYCAWQCNLGFQLASVASGSCAACPPKPALSYWNSSAAPCSFACNAGFYGHPLFSGVCVSCTVFMESVAPAGMFASKPQVGGIWNDTAGRCDSSSWACMSGYARSPVGDRYCCPLVIVNSRPAPSRQAVSPCNIICNDGYFWDTGAARCSPCLGLPGNAGWLPTQDAGACVWACNLGFMLTPSQSCNACPAKPAGASWLQQSSPPCQYSCNAGLYGHPTYPGICVTCTMLMTTVVPKGSVLPPPAIAGLWNDAANQCNESTWTCNAGYQRSPAGSRFCCPLNIANSAVAGADSINPCGILCNTGFYWNNNTLSCSACPQRPVNSNWKTVEEDADYCVWSCNTGYYRSSSMDRCLACPSKPSDSSWGTGSTGSIGIMNADPCAFVCNAGFYGHPTYAGVCVACDQLMSVYWRPRPRLPANAVWDDASGQCDPSSWVCTTGYQKFTSGTGTSSQQICCPSTVAHGVADPYSSTCGWNCEPGYYWSGDYMGCIPCSESLGLGESWGSDCDKTFSCALYAAQVGLTLPANAAWPPNSASSDQCVRWTCNVGFAQNGALCCSTNVVGYGLDGWEWTPGACSLRCKLGLFSNSAGQPCVSCNRLITATFGIDVCQRFRDPFPDDRAKCLVATMFIYIYITHSLSRSLSCFLSHDFLLP